MAIVTALLSLAMLLCLFFYSSFPYLSCLSFVLWSSLKTAMRLIACTILLLIAVGCFLISDKALDREDALIGFPVFDSRCFPLDIAVFQFQPMSFCSTIVSNITATLRMFSTVIWKPCLHSNNERISSAQTV